MTKISTTKGVEVPCGPRAHGAPEPIDPKTGQHASYYILSDEERAKGFVRAVRESYRHETCGAVTRMARAIAETFARDPTFYGSTFCVACNEHYPVSQFTWDGSDETMGT